MLWQPSSREIDTTQAYTFILEVNKQHQTKLIHFEDLYQWSCDYPELFWSSFWDYASITAEKKSSQILKNREDFLNSEWFPQAKLNFANNLLNDRSNNPAIVFWAEDKQKT